MLRIQWIILCTDQNEKILCSVKKILPPGRLFVSSRWSSTFSARASRSRSFSGSWSSSPVCWTTWIPSAWHIILEKKRIVQIRPELKLYKLIEGILCTMFENVFLVSLIFFYKVCTYKTNTQNRKDRFYPQSRDGVGSSRFTPTWRIVVPQLTPSPDQTKTCQMWNQFYKILNRSKQLNEFSRSGTSRKFFRLWIIPFIF